MPAPQQIAVDRCVLGHGSGLAAGAVQGVAQELGVEVVRRDLDDLGAHPRPGRLRTAGS